MADNSIEENDLQKAIDDIAANSGNNATSAEGMSELEAQIQQQMGTPPVPAAGAGTMPATNSDATAPEVSESSTNTSDLEFPDMMEMAEGVGAQNAQNTQNVQGGQGVDDSQTTPAADVTADVQSAAASASPAVPIVPQPASISGDAAGTEGAGALNNIEAPKQKVEQPLDMPVMNEVPALMVNKADSEVPEEVPVEEAPVIEPEMNLEPAEKPEDINSVKGAIARDLYKEIGDDDFEELTKDWSAKKRFELVRKMIEETGDTSMVVKGYDAAKGIEDEKERTEALLYLFENA